MKRVLLIITLALFGPLGLSAVSPPAAMAAQVRPELPIPKFFSCSSYPSIPSTVKNGGLPVYLGTSSGCLDGIHSCHVLGAYNGVQAVACMDIFVSPDGTHVYVYAA
jgi:hypothetical protein